jgi:membrane protease YdiL (CAAX protease family)
MILRVVVFYVLTLLFTMILGGLQQEAGLLPQMTFLPQWGPGIAGLLTMLVFRRRDGVGITFFSAGMPLLRYAGLILLPLIFGLLVYVFALLFLGRPEGLPLTAVVLASMIAGALGEEIGWRGYLHKRIAPHMNGLLSSLLVGLLWTAFHMHLWAGGVLYMAFAGLAFVSFSVMLYALLAGYQFNVLGATLFHVGINLAGALSFSFIEDLSLPFMMIYALVATLLAAAVVFARRDLFFAQRPGA